MTHISFSEFKNWIQCPFYHKLVNIDKIKLFKGNEYTAFGTAIHDTCERMLLTGSTNVDPGPYFFEKFRKDINNFCYYEPLHENLLFLNKEKLKDGTPSESELGHIDSKKPYFLEFELFIENNTIKYFKKEIEIKEGNTQK
mgnify:CR=1 FL=1